MKLINLKLRRYGYVVLLWLFSHCAAAQGRLPDQVLGVKNGLSQGFITSMLEDRQGFLWMGTKDGLNRWDGYRFLIYNRQPGNLLSLPDNYVTQLASDSAGNLWVGTETRGLVFFHAASGTFYEVALMVGFQMPRSYILQLQYKEGFLMVHFQEELMLLDVSRLEAALPTASLPDIRGHLSRHIQLSFTYSTQKPPHFPALRSQHELRFHWIGYKRLCVGMQGMVYMLKFTEGQIPQSHVIETPLAYRTQVARSCYVFGTGKPHQLLIAHKQGLIIMDDSTGSQIQSHPLPLTQPIDNEHLGNFFTDAAGYFYFPAGYDYFRLHPNGQMLERLYINFAPSIKFPYNRNVCVNQDGNLWIGTGGYGLYKFNINKRYFTTAPRSGYIIATPTDGRIIMSFDFKLHLAERTENTIRIRPLPFDKGQNASIWAGQHGWDGKDTLWVPVELKDAARKVLYAYSVRKGTWTPHTALMPDGKLDFFNWGIYAAKEGTLWQYFVNHEGEVVISKHLRPYKTCTPELFPLPARFDKIASRPIHAMHQAQDGTLWVGTLLGLYALAPQAYSWKFYPLTQGQNEDADRGEKILSICPDPSIPDQLIWVGTEGQGLFGYNLTTGAIRNVTKKDGLPNNVIYGILPDTKGNLWISTNNGLCCFTPATGFIRLFGVANGTAGQEFNRQQFGLLPSGEMLFGGVDGLTLFSPDSLLKLPTTTRRVATTAVYVDGRVYAPNHMRTGAAMPAVWPATLVVSSSARQISVEFSLPLYTDAESIEYRYQLEGFSKGWVYNQHNPTAIFTNLFPGKYVLVVQARSTMGDWLPNPLRLHIHVLYPWYLTWWFIILVLATFMLCIWLFIQWRLRQQTRVLRLRNMIAGDLHDEIGSTISSIHLYSDILQQRVQAPELQQIAGQIGDSARNILTNMSDIVWSINPKNDAFENIILRMQAHAHELLEAQQKSLTFSVQPGLQHQKLELLDRKNFYLIFKEALNNVLKYAACTEVTIELKKQGEWLHFVLADNGKGFDAAKATEGNGLDNMRRRAAELKGHLQIDTQPGRGCTIALQFPLP